MSDKKIYVGFLNPQILRDKEVYFPDVTKEQKATFKEFEMAQAYITHPSHKELLDNLGFQGPIHFGHMPPDFDDSLLFINPINKTSQFFNWSTAIVYSKPEA